MQELKVVARNSPLSLKQVEEVFKELGKEIKYEIIPVLSYGDKHKEISLMENIPTDFFTRELDEAILSCVADVAIHSAKDIPFPLPDGISLAALTKGKTQTDSLVSKNNLKLKDLPAGSRIGISSTMRKESLLNIRKDLEIVSIRGTIEERIKLVDNDFVDAIVVATCALERLGLLDRISEILPFETHPLQGKLAVTVRRDRPDFIKIFYDVDDRKSYGRVYLVGAGPGDPSLITIKAKNCIENADIILYDDLANPEILDFGIRVREKIYVGKRDGKHSIEQTEINRLLYKYATSGFNVVRLKGGDPLVFGRAQEEIDYLSRRFISVEVISGVSSAFAAAGDLGVSLSNRELGSKIILESGHLKGKEHKDKISSYVFYMGSSSKKEIYDKMKKFFSIDTPVLIVQNASLPEREIVKTTLEKLPQLDLASPIIIIIGKVGNYFVEQSKILYTGINPFETLSKIQGHLIHYPLIKRKKIYPLPEIKDSDYDVIVFTSVFAVDSWTDFFGIKKKKIYAIGPRTKDRLIERGYENVILPDKFNSVYLADLLRNNEKNSKILYPSSSISNNPITQLENVIKIEVYNTLFVEQKKLNLNNFNGVYFASSSCVDAFLKIYESIPHHLILYAGGIMTYERLKEIGEEKRTILLEKFINE